MRIADLTHTSQAAELGARDSKCILCTELKKHSSPREPKVRDRTGLSRNHFHFPESEIETVGLMEGCSVVMVAGEEWVNTQTHITTLALTLSTCGLCHCSISFSPPLCSNYSCKFYLASYKHIVDSFFPKVHQTAGPAKLFPLDC